MWFETVIVIQINHLAFSAARPSFTRRHSTYEAIKLRWLILTLYIGALADNLGN